MRIGIAGFSHESNSFSVIPTTLRDFQVWERQALIDHFTPTFHEIAGYIAGAKEFGYELYPLVAANATPAGPLTAETYETLVGKLLASLKNAPALDGLLLALHGAMVAEGFPHADAETVRRVREAVGPDFPLVVTHDYHGNVSEQLVADVDALVIYKTNPHIDQRERGLQAASILARTIRGEVKPVGAIAKPEVLFNIAYHNTSRPPMQPLMQAAIETEKKPGILACSIAAGYQYADVPAMGPSIVVVADSDPELAQREADRLGQMMWDIRDQLIPHVADPATAVRRAVASEHTPVALFDLGDNIGGGSSGDATVLLKELINQQADGWVVTIYDPEAANACAQSGIGSNVSLSVGGKTDDMHGPTLSITGRVRTLHDGTFEETERRHGGQRYWNQGLTAVVEVGRTTLSCRGLLILNSRRTSPNSIHQITCVGIQPQQQRILVAKGAVAPRAAYEPVCAEVIEVDTPGATAINRSPAEYHRARKSLYEWQTISL
ncbi:MAG: MlrC domain protein [Nitrospiraceae bacterium]|nr:MlrC domain protein [Nitrospiraceae bacterium]